VKKIIAVLAIASGLLLTGCSQADTAATLGDVKITQADLQTTVDSILSERTKVDTSMMQLETGEALNRGQLRFKILMTVFGEIAKELKLDITPALLAQKKAALVETIGGEANLSKNLVNAAIAPKDFDIYVRAIVINEQMAEALGQSGVAPEQIDSKIAQLLSAKAVELKVNINPRYGKWDEATGDITPSNPAGDAVTPSTE
jgi:hypothetical protein